MYKKLTLRPKMTVCRVSGRVSRNRYTTDSSVVLLILHLNLYSLGAKLYEDYKESKNVGKTSSCACFIGGQS